MDWGLSRIASVTQGLTTADCPGSQKEGGFLAGPLFLKGRELGVLELAVEQAAQFVLRWEPRGFWQVSWPQACQEPRAF